MSELTEIILRVLWRFYPIAWLTSVIVRGLSRIASWLEDEASWRQLAQSPQDCAYVGGWLALAEDRLNELIVRKAMRLLNRRYLPPRSQFAGHIPARAVRTPQDILARLTRLIVLYHDHKRLYALRARKLQRLFAEAELQLEVIHHPVEAQPEAADGCGGCGGCGCGGGSVRTATTPHPAQPIRGPPWLGLSFRQPEPIPTRKLYPCRAEAQRRRVREREIMPETIADRRLTPPMPLIHHLSRVRSLDVSAPCT